jgi:hypothetical protein
MDDFKSDIFLNLLCFLVSRKHFAEAKTLRLFWIPALAGIAKKGGVSWDCTAIRENPNG